MKRTLLSVLFVFVFIVLSSVYVTAQQGMLSSEEELIGETSEFAIGLHSGIFDCNQTVKYPFNIGVVAQYNYIPDVTKKWFFGTEVGAFYTSSKADDLNRKTRLTIMDLSIYPGISFPLSTKISAGDNMTLKVKKMAMARKFRMALGLAIAIPLQKKSEGPGVNIDAIKPGIGLTFRTSYDLPNRLTMFLNVTRIGRDLDGYAYKGHSSSERSNGNKHDLSYYFKAGFLWNFLNN